MLILGPGTELSNLLTSIGINPNEYCDCRTLINKMNVWGLEVCKERIQEIISIMKQNAEHYGWQDFIAAGLKSIATGLIIKINPFDPIPGLVDEALRRFESKQKM